MGKDVIIALDFDSREKTLAFFWTASQRRSPLRQGGHGAVLRRGSRHRPGDPPPGPPHLSGSEAPTSPTR